MIFIIGGYVFAIFLTRIISFSNFDKNKKTGYQKMNIRLLMNFIFLNSLI